LSLEYLRAFFDESENDGGDDPPTVYVEMSPRRSFLGMSSVALGIVQPLEIQLFSRNADAANPIRSNERLFK
jgi:hypothetical protein